jgi:hypothetical protein
MKRTLFLILVSFFTLTKLAIAQSYEVPKDYQLKAKDDYAKYETDVINTVDWLQRTSWDDEQAKRKEANAFFVAWITGSPTVSISVGAPLTKLANKNPELLITFMGGYTKYVLQHKDAPDVHAANVAGLKALIAKYQSEKNHKKDSAVEKLIKTDQDGKLDEWAATDFVKS